jgi:hypothetical protein
VKLAQRACEILGIRISQRESLDSLVAKLDRSTHLPYLSSTQKRTVQNVAEIVRDINSRRPIARITRKIQRIQNDILFDKFD